MAEGKGKAEAEESVKRGKGDLVAEACAAYGIAPEYLFAGRIDAETGEAVIVTRGGAKVRFKAGASVRPLSEIAVTGVNPEWAKKKVIAGKEKK